MLNSGTHAPWLLVRGFRQRDLVKVFAALDAIQPPVAILGGLHVGIAVTGFLGSAVGLLRAGAFIRLITWTLRGHSR